MKLLLYLQLDPLVLVWNYFVIHRIRIYRFREYYCCMDYVCACIFYTENVLLSKLELTILCTTCVDNKYRNCNRIYLKPPSIVNKMPECIIISIFFYFFFYKWSQLVNFWTLYFMLSIFVWAQFCMIAFCLKKLKMSALFEYMLEVHFYQKLPNNHLHMIGLLSVEDTIHRFGVVFIQQRCTWA